LMYEDMECGHIIAFARGGSSSDTNLEPICRICNRDMGIMDMRDYISTLKHT